MGRTMPAFSVLAGLVIALSACSSNVRQPTENVFAFRDIERMVSQPPGDDDASGIALAYQQKLRTFEGMYGEGVGPAKRAPEYLKCRQTFEMVSAAASAPAGTSIDDDVGIERSLLECRRAAEAWRGAAEMATFGSDVRRLTSGSMVVFGYTLQQHGVAVRGSETMKQGLTMLRLDRKTS